MSESESESEHSVEYERFHGSVTGAQGGNSDGRSTGNSKTQVGVRFDLGEAKIAAAATSGHEEAFGAGANPTTTTVCSSISSSRVPSFSFQEEERGETGKASRGEGEGDRYAATNGQCFVVRQQNGMHTAWRLHAPTCNTENPATTPTVHNNLTRAIPPINTRWEESVSADKLISLTRPSPPPQQGGLQQQHSPARLFLRRTRASLSTSATNTMGASARTADVTGALTGSGGRQIGVGSADLRAFPLPWSDRRSTVGNDEEARLQLSRGGRTRAEKGREGRSKVLTSPPHGGGWTTSSPAATAEQQHQRRGTGSSTPGCPPLRNSASRATGPRESICNTINRGHDENSPPPRAVAAACISSPAVRQNLARAARKSKVGTKADPVTLYRQRQELEQAQRKNAAARSRKKAASRGGRISDGSARGSDRTAGMGMVVDGRRARASRPDVGRRVGIIFR